MDTRKPAGSGGEQPARNRDIETADVAHDAPQRAEQDWDALLGADVSPEPVSPDEEAEGIPLENGFEKDGGLPEEDDDNPDQDSDEALPDDDEEEAIRRDLSGTGIRYKPE